jgi:hypothetical protein
VSFAAITLCVASQRVFIVVSLYFVVDSVRKLLDTPSYVPAFLLGRSVFNVALTKFRSLTYCSNSCTLFSTDPGNVHFISTQESSKYSGPWNGCGEQQRASRHEVRTASALGAQVGWAPVLSHGKRNVPIFPVGVKFRALHP